MTWLFGWRNRQAIPPGTRTLVRQVARFHGQFAIHAHYIDSVVDGPDIDEADGSGCGLNNLQHFGVGVHNLDKVLVSGDHCLQFVATHLDQSLQRFRLASGVFVQNQYNGLAIRPLPDFRPEKFGQVNGSDISHIVVFIYHDRHMVSKTRSEERQEKNKNRSSALKFHKLIQFQTLLPAIRLNKNRCPRSKNIVKKR